MATQLPILKIKFPFTVGANIIANFKNTYCTKRKLVISGTSYNSMEDVVEIDGSFLEGGGQILRNALSLSCILCQPIRVINIRANRPNPGLSNQHLYGLNLLQQITNARVKGNYLKSTEVEFHPGDIKSGRYTVDTKTAASVSLVLQAALPVLIFGSSYTELELIGGTNVGMAPQVDFLTEVFRPNLEMFGVSFDFDLIRRGYYPRGGGCCKVGIPHVKAIKAAQITKFGNITEVCGWCFVAGRIPHSVADEMKEEIQRELSHLGKECLFIEAYKESSNVARDNGFGLTIKGMTSQDCVVGVSALGQKKNGNQIASDAAKTLDAFLSNETCVDRYVQDQLIIFMALADGVSRIVTCDLTDHTKTAMHVAELLLGVKFSIIKDNKNTIIECKGTGHINAHI